MATPLDQFYNWVNSNPSSGTFELSADITISTTPPTGTISGTAIFDGNGKTITILKTTGGESFPGLFNCSGATIQNFKISVPGSNDWTLTGGWLLKDNSTGTVNYVTVNATPAIANNKGGFIATGGGGLVSFNNCVFSGSLTNFSGGFTYVATGGANRQFNNCISVITGATLSGGAGAGGFVFQGNPQFVNCISAYNGSDPGEQYAGFIANVSFTIPYSQCYFITGNTYSGKVFAANVASGTPNITFDGGCYAVISNPTSLVRLITDGIAGATNSFYLSSNVDSGKIGSSVTGNIQSSWNQVGNSSLFNTTYWNLTPTPPILTAFSASPWTSYTNAASPPTIDYSLICVRKGTLIQTPYGEKLVEDLKNGDMVTTLSGNVPIVSMFKRTIYTDSETAPCCIPKNTYGNGLPHTDLYLTQWHALWIENRFVHTHCAKYHPVESEIGIPTTYYHIAVEKYPEVMYANGMPVETSGYYHRPHVHSICGENECKIIVEKEVSSLTI